MARNDGIDRTIARNVNLTVSKIANAQRHNEREKESYTNPDIVPERLPYNVHYKSPTGSYSEMFEKMKADGIISTRSLKDDAKIYGELIFDVNSAYFYNHGGYEFAKQFYADAYKAAVEIVGGEQYILSAVMHADERNKAMSETLGEDVFHYHLHVVYIPVVEKQILWSKRCKDKSLIGTVKETVMQVSSSKKWISKPSLDENGNPMLSAKGKAILRKSYGNVSNDAHIIRSDPVGEHNHFLSSRAGKNFQFRRIFLKTGLAKKQKVTEVFYNAKDPTAEIHTHDIKLKKRLREYAAKFPELCQQTDDDEQGGLRFEIDKRRISIRLTVPYSEDRRRAASNLAKKTGIHTKV